MKLFQQMLVATASGLISLSPQASDVLNLEGMNDYISRKKSSTKRYFDSKTFVNDVNEDIATLSESKKGLESYQNNLKLVLSLILQLLTVKLFYYRRYQFSVNTSGVVRVDESVKATYMMQSNLQVFW